MNTERPQFGPAMPPIYDRLPRRVLPIPGMRLVDGARVLRIERYEKGRLLISLSPGGQTLNWGGHIMRLPTWPSEDKWQIDLTDPITEAGLLPIARSLCGPLLCASPAQSLYDGGFDGWTVYVNPYAKPDMPQFWHPDSLAKALLAAIWWKMQQRRRR